MIDVGYRSEEIVSGIKKALRTGFRKKLRKLKNPYGNGDAAAVIVKHLKNIPLTEALLSKKFHDIKSYKEHPK